MSKPRSFSTGVVAFVSVMIGAGAASAATDCQFSLQRRNMVLQNDCTTDATILIPDGFTLNGGDHTITAVDPVGGHFVGAVVRNAGSRADVRNLRVTASNLFEFCDPGDDKLRGISFVGASGSIVGNAVFGINQNNATSGCQEGTGIEAQNLSGGPETEVRIVGNSVDAYQKTGIAVSGAVRAEVRANLVTGYGPVSFIAQNGIQIGFGADAAVTENLVRDNSYTGPQNVQATGVLVVGGPTITTCTVSPCPFTTGTRIARNVLLENDVGVFLSNPANALGEAPETRTNNVVQDNIISKSSLTNGVMIQIGVLDFGNRDRITGNVITGAGYDPAANPGAFTVPIFAEPPFAVDPVIRRNITP